MWVSWNKSYVNELPDWDWAWSDGIASHADVLRGSSRVPAPRTSADLGGKQRRPITADFQIWKVHFGPWENFVLDFIAPEKNRQVSWKWRPYSFRTIYSVNSQAFVLVATLTISLKKITSEVKFAERKSALLQNNNVWKKILPFVQSYKVTPPLHHPKNNFMSKWHLIQPLQREIYKNPTFIP